MQCRKAMVNNSLNSAAWVLPLAIAGPLLTEEIDPFGVHGLDLGPDWNADLRVP